MSIADEQRVSASGATTAQSASQPDAYSPQVIRKLNDLTSDFYAREAASFSATRQAPWHGWERVWKLITAHDAVQNPFPSHAARVPDDDTGDSGAPLTILDLGCGNLRFERFLAERTNAPLRVTALDNCPDLASPEIGALSAAFPHSLRSSSAASKTKEEDASGQGANPPEKTIVDLRALDIVESLLDGTFADRLPRNSHDLAVAFGLMHHLPTFALRARVLEGLLGSLRPGGFAVVSFWQFLNDPRLAAKAATVTAEGRAAHCLPTFHENDFLLGWQHAEGVYRFCHHTPEDEIDALLAAIREPNAPSTSGCASAAPPSFREIARFSADGKQENLNRYLILQRL
ncbi:class I SAM-dependent methyltransferase [Adlercreutzia sp.]|uniref:class I SAM-dependent methyltransferase n=1 Tax=Adlercreutzia sp. TaxID=1872387 RepID=UPI003AB61731